MNKLIISIEVNNTTEVIFENIDILSSNIPNGLLIKKDESIKLDYDKLYFLNTNIKNPNFIEHEGMRGIYYTAVIKIGEQTLVRKPMLPPNGFPSANTYFVVYREQPNTIIESFKILKIIPKANFRIDIYNINNL